MPVKTHKTNPKKVPKHYAKVYWPYLPLILLVIAGLWLGHPTVERSQRGTVDFATNLSPNELLTNTNQQRAANGYRPLEASNQLTAAATAKAKDMVKHNYWTVVGPDSKTPLDFVQSYGYNSLLIGENMAYGFEDSQQTIKGWLNSPIHKANLLNPDYQQVGFGIQKSKNFLNSGPETVVVAFFAAPANSTIDYKNITDSMPQLLAEGTTSISRIQTMTNGRAPWIGLALSIMAIAGLVFLFIKNAIHLRQSLKKGQKFVLKHPVLDLTIIAFAALVALLCQGVGYIK